MKRNPNIEPVSNPKSGISFGELYNRTIERIKNLEEEGYKVIYKWGK